MGGRTKKIRTARKEVNQFINSLNTMNDKPNWLTRLYDKNPMVIQDWEYPDYTASHKIAYDSEPGDRGYRLYPNVQMINGELIDFTNPKYGYDDAYDSADKNHDYIYVTPKQAEWFGPNYKPFFPATKKNSDISKREAIINWMNMNKAYGGTAINFDILPVSAGGRVKAAYGDPPYNGLFSFNLKTSPFNNNLKKLNNPTKYLKQQPTLNLLEFEHKIDSIGYANEKDWNQYVYENPGPTTIDYVDAGLAAVSLASDFAQKIPHPLVKGIGKGVDLATNVASSLLDAYQTYQQIKDNDIFFLENAIETKTNLPPTNKYDYVGDVMSIANFLSKFRNPYTYIPQQERRQVKQDNTYVDINKNNIPYSLEDKAYGGYLTEEILPEKYVMKRRLNRRKAAFGVPTSPMEALAQDNIYRDTALSQASQVLDPIMAGVNQGLDLAGELLSTIDSDQWAKGAVGGTNSKWYQANKSRFAEAAYGNSQQNIPIEVEDGETAQLPNGQMIGFNGASHEYGGIDVDLPEGTEIYSQRLTRNGQTLADRKVEREEKMKRATQKVRDRVKEDKLAQNTLERLQMINDYQEAQDTAFQNGVRDLVSQIYGDDSGVYPQANAACGGRVKAAMGLNGKDFYPIDNYFLNENFVPMTEDGTRPREYSTTLPSDIEFAGINAPIKIKYNPETDNNSKFNWNNFLSSATLGNLNVLAGNMYQGIAPYLTTLKQREGDMPNVNTFRDYNKDAIRSIKDAMDASARTRDTQLADLELSRRSALNDARNQARSVNTLNALDAAMSDYYNQGTEKVYNAYQDNYNKLLVQLSGLQSDRDLKYMTAEDQRNERDTQDRDAFYRNLAKDNAEIGRAIAQSGKDLNAMRLAVYNSNLINQLSKYGIGIDRNGNLYELPKEEQAYGGRVRRTSKIRNCR